MQITFIFSMIFAVIISVFALANASPVTISLIFKTYELSQAVVILISAVIGAVVVFLLNLVSKAKSVMKNKNLSRQIKELENQLTNCQSQLEETDEQVVEEDEIVTENNETVI